MQRLKHEQILDNSCGDPSALDIEIELHITERSRKTCQLINLLTMNGGRDVSEDIDRLVYESADVSVLMPLYRNEQDCSGDTYDDFLPKHSIDWYYDKYRYPITYAIAHHCHVNVLRTLHKHTQEVANAAAIYDCVKAELQRNYVRLYNGSYFAQRALKPGTYHNKLKGIIDSYLEVLGLGPDIFIGVDLNYRSPLDIIMGWD